MTVQNFRSSWDEHFIAIAYLIASRSTCIAKPVGALIVRNREILATGYNSVPEGTPDCTAQGYCYEGVLRCDQSTSPSRAIHAEVKAITHAAKHGISIENSTMYVTLEPCLSCLKAIIAAGITEVLFSESFHKKDHRVRQGYLEHRLITMRQI